MVDCRLLMLTLTVCVVDMMASVVATNVFSISDCPSSSILIAERTPKYLTSPHHPNNYGARSQSYRLSCSWLIQANSSYSDVVIQMHVHNSSLEYSTACTRDYVTVINGPKDFHRPLISWCGTKIPSTITSTSNKVLVMFGSDFKNNHYTGFFLSYWAAKKPQFSVKYQPWTPVNYVLMVLGVILILGIGGTFLIIYYVQQIRPRYRRKHGRHLLIQ